MESVPSQAPTVPPEDCEGRRWVGDLTQSTLELPKDLWRSATAETIGTTAEWTNKVELADLKYHALRYPDYPEQEKK